MALLKNKMIDYRVVRENLSKAAWNVSDHLQGLSVEEIRQRHQPLLGFSVCLCNCTGDLNVGSMIRTAVVFGAEKVYIAGRKRIDNRSLVGADNYIDIEYIEEPVRQDLHLNYEKIVYKLVNDGYIPYVVEQGGTNHRSMKYEKKPCFMFGNEGLGFDQEFVWWFNQAYGNVVSIVQHGVLRSMNVSNVAAIIMEQYINGSS